MFRPSGSARLYKTMLDLFIISTTPKHIPEKITGLLLHTTTHSLLMGQRGPKHVAVYVY